MVPCPQSNLLSSTPAEISATVSTPARLTWQERRETVNFGGATTARLPVVGGGCLLLSPSALPTASPRAAPLGSALSIVLRDPSARELRDATNPPHSSHLRPLWGHCQTPGRPPGLPLWPRRCLQKPRVQGSAPGRHMVNQVRLAQQPEKGEPRRKVKHQPQTPHAVWKSITPPSGPRPAGNPAPSWACSASTWHKLFSRLQSPHVLRAATTGPSVPRED